MANLRIRYQAQRGKKNTVISIQEFVSDSTGAKYRIVLDYTEMVFKIRNERIKEFVFKSKAYGNLHVLKRNARNKLKDFGVPVHKESRDRTFGRCDKGHSQDKEESNN